MKAVLIAGMTFMAFTIGLSLGSMQSNDEVARLRKQVDDSIHTAEEALKVQQRWEKTSQRWEAVSAKWEKIAIDGQAENSRLLRMLRRQR